MLLRTKENSMFFFLFVCKFIFLIVCVIPPTVPNNFTENDPVKSYV